MFQVLKGGQPEVEFWNAAGRGKKTNEEWKQFFEGRGFRAGVDFPPSLFYEKLMEIFPDAAGRGEKTNEEWKQFF